MSRTKFGDPSTSTDDLVDMFKHYHEGLTQTGECIHNDCDVISKPYAKIISERLAQYKLKETAIRLIAETDVKDLIFKTDGNKVTIEFTVKD